MGGSGINVDGVRMMPEVFATLRDCSGTLRVRSSRPGGELGGRGRDRGGKVDWSVARGIAGLDNVLLIAGIVVDGVANAIEGAIVEMGYEMVTFFEIASWTRFRTSLSESLVDVPSEGAPDVDFDVSKSIEVFDRACHKAASKTSTKGQGSSGS